MIIRVANVVMGSHTRKFTLCYIEKGGSRQRLLVSDVSLLLGVYFGINNVLCRILQSFELRDDPGVLTVGGETSSNFYAGDLQDVRIYFGELQPR